MRLAPARLSASSGLGCDLAAGSDRVCMTMSGARSSHRGRGCPTALPWPPAVGGQGAAGPRGRAIRAPRGRGRAPEAPGRFRRALGPGAGGAGRRQSGATLGLHGSGRGTVFSGALNEKICGAGESWRKRVSVDGHRSGPWLGSDGDSVFISCGCFLWCHC